MTLTLDLPVRVEPDQEAVTEELQVEDLGTNRFRLVSSPGLVEGLAKGDEFELDEASATGFRVTKRSGLVVVWFFWPSEDLVTGPESAALQRQVEQELGGRLDGGGHTQLIFSIPVGAGFTAIEALFQEAEARHPGATTMFGNVYGPDGETPLNWWQDSH